MTSKNREEEALQMYNRARSIVAEGEGSASFATLRTALFIVREALVRWPGPTLCSDSLDDLEAALVMKVRDASRHHSSGESHSLNGEILDRWKNDFMRITKAYFESIADVRRNAPLLPLCSRSC